MRLHEVLDRHGIPHAFGGALAVDYYRVPRGTIDIDLAILLPPGERDRVIDALEEEFLIPDKQGLAREIDQRDQGITHWHETRVDLFFSIHEFHDAVAKRVRRVGFKSTTIPIVSAEDIVVFKVLFDRPQDWADIDAVCKLQGEKLDLSYMTKWLERIVGQEDPRVTRLARLFRGGEGE